MIDKSQLPIKKFPLRKDFFIPNGDEVEFQGGYQELGHFDDEAFEKAKKYWYLNLGIKHKGEKMITAAEAKKRTESVSQGKNAIITSEIEALIDEAIMLGSFCINYYNDLPKAVETLLKEKGFTCSYYNGFGFRDDESYTMISWR